MPDLKRRDFLKLVGVSAGGAAAAGCSDHVEKLIPYVVQPEEITPGIAVWYASTCQECSAGCGLHVRTREARPVKLEGNPDHPINKGKLCARGQAGIGRTYHPDRFRGPMTRDADGTLQPISWEDATAQLVSKLTAAGSKARMIGGTTGPTLTAVIDGFNEAAGLGPRVRYEPFAGDALREAAKAVFGVESEPLFDLSGSDYVIDFGSDAMDTGRSPTEHQRQLAESRDINTDAGKKARLVYVGPRLDTTAASSDEWLAPVPGSEGLLALGIAKVAFDVRSKKGQPVGGDPALIAGVLRGFTPDAVAKSTGVDAATIRRIGQEIAGARRAVALPPGVGLTSSRAVAANAAVLLLDAVLDAIGTRVDLAPAAGGASSFGEVRSLVDAMKSGGVSVLLVHGSNPAYSLPASLGFGAALENVGFVVSFASLPDETSARADLVLPDHTPLESWGDAGSRPGVRSLVQPTLRPLFDTRALGDTLITTAKAMGVASRLPDSTFQQMVEAAWADTDWRQALAAGGRFRKASAAGGAVSISVAGVKFQAPELDGSGDFVLLANPSPLLGDGSGANLPWLQETPDPVTKIAWQSWAELSRDTAKKLGINEGDVVTIETSAGSVELPIYPRGGLRDDVVAVATGQGHTVGLYASRENDGKPGEARGVNVLDLLPASTDESGGRIWLSARAKVTPTGGHRRLPNTQRNDNKRGRQLGESITLAAFTGGHWNEGSRAPLYGTHGERDHAGGNVEVPLVAEVHHGDGHADAHGGGHAAPHEIHRPYDMSRDAVDGSAYRWGMTIDVDRCNGCSACVVACSIENNIPNVGEAAVLRSRQMSWLRIERFVGEGERELLTGRQRPDDREQLGNTDVRNSPMLCQQCGAAPCEPVCPVLATYHNEEGLNAMIYNRCIGTRYCANNCPYKVRRFNWFDYQIENIPEPMQYMLNPDVTVRAQGVMEKCTFCVQRIQDARQGAKDAGRDIADGAVTPACAQTCPSDAIAFGNMRDDASRVSKLAQQPRSYHALQVLNTRPGVTYLAKVRRSEEDNHG